jgi:two-component system chemotaxis response regulator CheB
MRQAPPEAIVIGASAGALEALSTVLPALPAAYPLPVLVVIHVPADRNGLMVELLRTKCQVRVCEAEDKEPILPGTVYLAPPDYHLLVERDRRISLSSEEAVNYSRPSIDVLFESAAQVYRDRLVGVILTGANSDGAAGLQTVESGGGLALVQRPESAYSAAMPRAALEACRSPRALTLPELASFLAALPDAA